MITTDDLIDRGLLDDIPTLTTADQFCMALATIVLDGASNLGAALVLVNARGDIDYRGGFLDMVAVGEQLDNQRSTDQPLLMAAIRNGLATDSLSEATFPHTTGLDLNQGTVTALGFPHPPFGALLIAGTEPLVLSPGAKKLLATITQLWLERRSTGWPVAQTSAQVTPENSGIIFSARQLDVLRLLGEGMTNPQIGKTLSISASLAKQEVAFLSHALQAKSRLEVVVTAQRLGLLPVG